MSNFNNASLIVTPNSYKAGKLYSIKPTSGAGDLDVVRATSATRVNEQGLVEIPRTNLVLRSEEFENSNWLKQQISVTSNNSTAPNGTATADKIIPDTTSNQHRLYTQANFSGTGVLSVYAKADGYNFLSLGFSGGIVGAAIIFNLTNGTISGTASGVTPNIQNIGNGWYRCSISSASLGSGSPLSYVVIVRDSNSTANYAGDGVSGVLVWGAQLEVGNVATEYIPTTSVIRTKFAGITQDGSSASNIPRLDYTNGSCPSILVEPQRTNLDPNSQTFVGWVLSNGGGVTISNVNTTNPFGFSSVTKVIPQTTLGQHRPFLSTTYSAVGRIWVIAKADGYNFLSFGEQGGVLGSSIIFNLLNGTISGSAFGYTPEISSLGDGWYKCSLNMSATGLFSRFIIIRNNNTINDYSGDGTSGILIAHKQLEVGLFDTSAIITSGTIATRNADVISKTGLSGITSITETFEDNTTNVISGSPTSYTMSQGRIKNVIGI